MFDAGGGGKPLRVVVGMLAPEDESLPFFEIP
jgi:hypothetical protein